MNLHDFEQIFEDAGDEQYWSVVQLGDQEERDRAVFRPDIDIQVVWWSSEPDRGRRVFEFTDRFPDSESWIAYGEGCFRGVPVLGRNLLAVDGGRAYLPLPHLRHHDDLMYYSSNPGEYFLPKGEMAMARLLDQLSGRGDFDKYVEMSGLPVQ